MRGTQFSNTVGSPVLRTDPVADSNNCLDPRKVHQLHAELFSLQCWNQFFFSCKLTKSVHKPRPEPEDQGGAREPSKECQHEAERREWGREAEPARTVLLNISWLSSRSRQRPVGPPQPGARFSFRFPPREALLRKDRSPVRRPARL